MSTLREVKAAAARRTNDKRTVWGLTLSCGHYVERAALPQRQARCDDCLIGTPVIPALVLACSPCNGSGFAANTAEICPTCQGFRNVEWYPSEKELVARPGSWGDHIAAMWANRLTDGTMEVLVIAKRGRRWLGERSHFDQDDTGPKMSRSRFYPPADVSQDALLESHEEQRVRDHDAGRYMRRAFVEMRTANHDRLRAMNEWCAVYLLHGWPRERP